MSYLSQRVGLACLLNDDISREAIEVQCTGQTDSNPLDWWRKKLHQHVIESMGRELRAVDPGLVPPSQELEFDLRKPKSLSLGRTGLPHDGWGHDIGNAHIQRVIKLDIDRSDPAIIDLDKKIPQQRFLKPEQIGRSSKTINNVPTYRDWHEEGPFVLEVILDRRREWRRSRGASGSSIGSVSSTIASNIVRLSISLASRDRQCELEKRRHAVMSTPLADGDEESPWRGGVEALCDAVEALAPLACCP